MKMFRQLNKEEEKRYRLWARDNYDPMTPINGLWHPVTQTECVLMNSRLMEEFYTIQDEDVGKPTLNIRGIHILVSDFLGRVLPIDVGKRVSWVRDDADTRDVYQVENDAQLAARQG